MVLRTATKDDWWRQGMMGGAKAHYDGIVAFLRPTSRKTSRRSLFGGKRARLADIEAQLDGGGNFVDVLAARAGSANKDHCKFGIWNEYGRYFQNSP